MISFGRGSSRGKRKIKRVSPLHICGRTSTYISYIVNPLWEEPLPLSPLQNGWSHLTEVFKGVSNAKSQEPPSYQRDK